MTTTNLHGPLVALRQFVRPRESDTAERCELCGAVVAPEHQHVLNITNRKLHCACDSCSILFSGQGSRLQSVPHCVQFLSDFRMKDERWEALGLPTSLAFIFKSSQLGKTVAMYPGAAGAAESSLTLDAWDALAADNPVLHTLQSDVEALLVNRMSQPGQYFRIPIDRCYQLTGIIRAHWRGFSGGPDVWEQIAQFFANLKAHATATVLS